MVNGNLNECIQSLSGIVQATIEKVLQDNDKNFLFEIPDDSLFNNGIYNSKIYWRI